MTENTCFIYMLLCSNNSYYTGYTTDIDRRYQEHCDGSIKCKYTRAFPPKKLAACWQASSKSLAMQIEHAIKQLDKAQKQVLVLNPKKLSTLVELEGIEEVTVYVDS